RPARTRTPGSVTGWTSTNHPHRLASLSRPTANAPSTSSISLAAPNTRKPMDTRRLSDPKRPPSAEAATLGEPSYVWRSGQERRLQLIRRYVRLEGAWILDVGCGIGTYVQRFAELTAHPYGIDVSLERLRQARAKGLTRVLAAAGERLPFSDRSFDVVVFNEVI